MKRALVVAAVCVAATLTVLAVSGARTAATAQSAALHATAPSQAPNNRCGTPRISASLGRALNTARSA